MRDLLLLVAFILAIAGVINMLSDKTVEGLLFMVLALLALIKRQLDS